MLKDFSGQKSNSALANSMKTVRIVNSTFGSVAIWIFLQRAILRHQMPNGHLSWSFTRYFSVFKFYYSGTKEVEYLNHIIEFSIKIDIGTQKNFLTLVSKFCEEHRVINLWTLMNTDKVWRTLDELWQTMTNYAKFWWTLTNYDKLCQILMNSDKLWQIMPDSDELWQTMPMLTLNCLVGKFKFLLILK